MNKKKKYLWLHVLILMAIGFVFWYPAARHLENWGDNMWYRAFMLAGAARRSILVYHQLPFWNPYAKGGIPLLAYPLSSFLSPTFTLPLIFGPAAGLKFRILLSLWIGLCGSYLLGRRLAPGRFAPYLCCFTYMLSSWYPLYMSSWHDEFIPIVYLPWLLLFYHKGMESIRWCVGGGVALALMILEGGIYPVPYALLFLSLYAFLEAAFRKRFSPLLPLCLIVLLGLAFSAVKLVPTLDFLSRNPRPFIWKEPVLPWRALPRIFFGRDQVSETDFRGAWLGWWEYGAYIGVIPMLLALAAPFVAGKRAVPIAILAILFFGLMFGDYGILSPWHWVHKLYAFSSLHDPIRFRVVLIFCLSILAAITLSCLERKQEEIKSPIVSMLLILLILWVAVDLFLVNGRIYTGISSRQPIVPRRWGSFRQNKLPQKEQEAFAFLCFLENEGLINNYDGFDLQPCGVMPYYALGYRGEAWLARGEGSLETLLCSPNRLKYKLELKAPSVLFINQRYDPGWRTVDGRPVFSRWGIIAVPVGPNDGEVCLYYIPKFFYVGCALSILGILFAVFLLKYSFF